MQENHYDRWLTIALGFYKQYLNVHVFPQPFETPDESSQAGRMPVFIPAGLTVQNVITRVLKPMGWEFIEDGITLSQLGGLEPGATPRLHLIEESVYPSTHDMSVHDLIETGIPHAGLIEYLLSFAMRLHGRGQSTDVNTMTVFPDHPVCNIGAAVVKSLPTRKRIELDWKANRLRDPAIGARRIIKVPLKHIGAESPLAKITA